MSDSHGGSSSSGHAGASKSHDTSDRQVVVFVAIIAAALALALGSVFVLKLHPLIAFFALAIVATALVFLPKIEVFAEYERGVIFRMGKFLKVAGPGMMFILPIIDRMVRIDLRDQLVDIPPQNVITHDNISLVIDALVYTHVTDPFKAVTAVQDYQKAIASVLTAEIRNIIAKMDLELVLEKTEEINSLLTRRAQESAEKWGVTATRVEVEHIDLPKGIKDAMNKRREAEEWKARITTEAQARQIYVRALNEVASGLSPTTMQYLYLDSLKRIGESSSTKIVLPMEISNMASELTKRFAGLLPQLGQASVVPAVQVPSEKAPSGTAVKKPKP